MRIAVVQAGMVTAALVLVAGCGSSADPVQDATAPGASGAAAAAGAGSAASTVELGAFLTYPAYRLPKRVSVILQDELDASVERGTIRGATAAVAVIGSGSWWGAAGVDRQGNALTTDSQLLTASVGKTVTAAQVLRLVDEGRLRLDDAAADHFPRELSAYDANGASVRDLLGMRSGFADPDDYVDLVDEGYRTADLMKLTKPTSPAGSTTEYANINFLLLGEIIEQVTGRPLAAAIRDGVLDDPDLERIEYGVKDAMAADGWRMLADPAALVRWGYQLYGGFVVSDESLQAMTDFQGESYGLGTIDFSGWDEYNSPGAVGHGGMETSHAVRLVAFPETGVVVSVQANADDLEQIGYLVKTLAAAARS